MLGDDGRCVEFMRKMKIERKEEKKLEERNTWLGTERYRSIGGEVLLEGTMI